MGSMQVTLYFGDRARLQNSRFFSKISKEIDKAWRKSVTPVWGVWVFLASLPSLALCFQPPSSRPFVWLLARTWISKIRTVLQSRTEQTTIWARGSIVKMSQIKIIHIFSLFKRVPCLVTFLFILVVIMVAPSPQKSNHSGNEKTRRSWERNWVADQ